MVDIDKRCCLQNMRSGMCGNDMLEKILHILGGMPAEIQHIKSK